MTFFFFLLTNIILLPYLLLSGFQIQGIRTELVAFVGSEKALPFVLFPFLALDRQHTLPFFPL